MQSPFESHGAHGHTPGDRPNAAGQVGVRLQASVLPRVTQISTWITGTTALEAALQQALGAAPPAQSGKTMATPHGLLARTGPEEFLLLGDTAAEVLPTLRQAVMPGMGSVTDLSHARCRIRIEGTQCRTVLNKLFALDLRESEFPVGEVRLTGTHHVPSLLHRRAADAFDMLVFTTYARDQLATVVDAALEYGVGLELNSAR